MVSGPFKKYSNKIRIENKPWFELGMRDNENIHLDSYANHIDFVLKGHKSKIAAPDLQE